MAPKQKFFADIGTVEKRDDEYRARVQYRYQGRAVSRVSMSFNLKGPAAWRLPFEVKPGPKGVDVNGIKPKSLC